ncbi:hypothetical protein BD770DRAFT_381405 [Pilaira anomala]|nr:hypothetical protein BD770DRAFT_381405 [Pilaira anomala]
MLLAQPFDPFKPQRKIPFFVKHRLFSRTRRALLSLKNKMYNNNINNNNRQFQPCMMPDNHFMLPPQRMLPPPPPPSSWYYCYNGCYDPFQSPMPFPPPPPPSLYSTMHPLQIPYCICIHISAPHPTPERHKDAYSQNESTLYNSSNSSMYSCNEKMEQEENYYRDNYPTALTQSDILLEKTNAQRLRPSLRRWNSSSYNNNNNNNNSCYHE